jgi:hypothetical protein
MYNQDQLFNIQSGGSPSGIRIYYHGSGIADITGPEPFVDITRSYNSNSNNTIQSISNTIDLNGKIVSTNIGALDTGGYTGTSGIIYAIKRLEELFNCQNGLFEIKCNDETLYAASGVRVTNLTINKSNDNWVSTADYSVNLEYITSADPSYNVTDKNESWTIEPEQDIIYNNLQIPINGKPEDGLGFGQYSPSQGSINAINGAGSMLGSSADVKVIPQFRISRRLSAKGLPIPSGTGLDCATSDQANNNNNRAYLYAKQWVEDQLKRPFDSLSNEDGSPYFFNGFLPSTGTTLYNHSRSTSLDIYNGTYEVTDNWLAMPEHIGYIETYTIDRTTSPEFITTIRVAGNIQGLSKTTLPMMTGQMNFLPQGTGLNNQIDLSYSNVTGDGVIGGSVANNADGNNNLSSRTTKYDSAKDGWVQKIKPLLYRRACLGMQSYDRNKTYNYVEPDTTHPNYSSEQLLNVIPTSTTEGHDPHKGTITYNYEFNNKFNIFGNSVLSENISITNDGPADSISETQVLGRALGPILQSNGRTSARKTINVELVVVPPITTKATLQSDPSCPFYPGNPLWKNVDTLIEGNKPFGNRTNVLFGNAQSQNEGVVFVQSDQESWSPSQGRYSRSVSWTYQQCTTNRFYLDH